ncbi:hypothetical protein B7992_14430 [Fibrobacter sp. UWH1]|nr:hypothetical protein B7992_14430 [Fibrobacter sp. UWH1]
MFKSSQSDFETVFEFWHNNPLGSLGNPIFLLIVLQFAAISNKMQTPFATGKSWQRVATKICKPYIVVEVVGE